jgi:hypothetical protein
MAITSDAAAVVRDPSGSYPGLSGNMLHSSAALLVAIGDNVLSKYVAAQGEHESYNCEPCWH